MHLVNGQRHRLERDQLRELDRELDWARYRDAKEEAIRRAERWKRRRALKTPLLWMVALAAACMTWFARRGK